MHSRIFDRLLREWEWEREAFVPRLPLVHVIGTEKVSCLPGHDVQRGVVKIGQINCHALGRSGVPGYSFHGKAAAGLRLQTRSGPAPQYWNLT